MSEVIGRLCVVRSEGDPQPAAGTKYTFTRESV